MLGEGGGGGGGFSRGTETPGGQGSQGGQEGTSMEVVMSVGVVVGVVGEKDHECLLGIGKKVDCSVEA